MSISMVRKHQPSMIKGVQCKYPAIREPYDCFSPYNIHGMGQLWSGGHSAVLKGHIVEASIALDPESCG